jgi:N-acetylglutamate synthase-like GNAT family acetyltransferase
MNIRERRESDFDRVRVLLENAGLPVKGIDRTRGWVAEEDGQIASHIALEETSDAVVLRSLATTPSAQRRGFARALMESAEQQAGSRAILLRTKTVGPWVLKRGYVPAQPEQIPQSVRATSEFEGSLCSGFPVYIRNAGTETPSTTIGSTL